MKKILPVLIALAFQIGFMTVLIWGGALRETIEITVVRDQIDGTPGNPTLRYLLIDPGVDANDDDFEPFDPSAVLMLFPGGDGRLFLEPGSRETDSKNFLARTRYHFAAEGFVVALIDAASDFLAHNHDSTRTDGFRHRSGLQGHRFPSRPASLFGDKYKVDLQAVIDDLRGRFPDLPLWAVGTSRGAISAAVAAAELDRPPDGMVLHSSLTGPSNVGDLSEVDLDQVVIPTLIVTNEDDECINSKPEDSKDLKARFTVSPRVQVLIFNGGTFHLTRNCGPLSRHGFFGIEQKAIEKIGKWIMHIEEQ